VLTDAAIRGARDDLLGLKENIIIGHPIPAGSGIYRYHDIEIEPPEGFEPPPPPLDLVAPGAVPVPEEAEVETLTHRSSLPSDMLIGFPFVASQTVAPPSTPAVTMRQPSAVICRCARAGNASSWWPECSSQPRTVSSKPPAAASRVLARASMPRASESRRLAV